MATFCIEICMILFLKDRMSSIFSDLLEEINQITVTQIVLYKWFSVKPPSRNLRKICAEEVIEERDL